MPGKRSSTREMLQCLRRLPNSPQLAETLARIIGAYKSDNEPWIVGYSGGKDSTAVVKLVFQSLLRVRDRHKPVTVIYCDTGVEIPMASALARKALKGLVKEARAFDLPIRARILSPPLDERFFVKVIGRGYRFLRRVDDVDHRVHSNKDDSRPRLELVSLAALHLPVILGGWPRL
jgi:3'-phosphoadenosine 5'-phosphosulfate sulfotransferase (PAPS reductase)/FAD synthetase